jgi:hypothetical protein
MGYSMKFEVVFFCLFTHHFHCKYIFSEEFSVYSDPFNFYACMEEALLLGWSGNKHVRCFSYFKTSCLWTEGLWMLGDELRLRQVLVVRKRK